MTKALTQRQQNIYDFIVSFMKNRGYPPTLREIGNEYGISSTNGVKVNLDALEKKNYIIRRRWLSRGIELVDKPKEEIEFDVNYVPILSKITNKEHIFDSGNIDGLLAVDDSFFETQKAFACNVKDDSMSEDGIVKGDYVLAKRQSTAEPEEIIVAIKGNEILVRKFDGNLQIIGKVIGLMRKY